MRKVRKKRTFNDREELRGIIRKQSKEIKELKKQLGRLNKTTNRLITEDLSFHIKDEEIVPASNKETNKPKCLKCGKPSIEVDMGIKKVYLCKHCGYKKVI